MLDFRDSEPSTNNIAAIFASIRSRPTRAKVRCTVALLVVLAAIQPAVLSGCKASAALDAPDSGLASLGAGATGPRANANPTDIAAMAEQSARDIEAFREQQTTPKAPSARSAASVPLDITTPSMRTPERNNAAEAEIPRTTRAEGHAPATKLDAQDRHSEPTKNPAIVSNALDMERATPAAVAIEPAPENQVAALDANAPESALGSLGSSVSPSAKGLTAGLSAREALAAELGSVVAKTLRFMGQEAASGAAGGSLAEALEAVHPGFFASLDDAGSALRRAVPPSDVTELLAHRARAAPATGAAAMSQAPPAPPLSIATAVLCSKVTSFGRYDPIVQESFFAAEPVRALVYVEVEGFANKESGDGQRLVELSQRLSLYPENGSVEVWGPPERAVRESARRVRRDFYLVQHVDLPRNLSLGAYSLKVTVVDKVSGAQAEATIPLRIVAGDRSASGQ